MGILELRKLFSFDDIEIIEISLADLVPESHIESINTALNKQFPNSKVTLYHVIRHGKGLVQPIAALEICTKEDKGRNFFAVRYFERNNEPYRTPEFFDRALFHSKRMENLKNALGHHYPQISILNLKDGTLILQAFLFFSVCSFTNLHSWEELFDIMFLASQNKIFLDYNHNHWLYSTNNGLYYVDKDYNEDLESIKESVVQNFNQASIFINEINPPFIIQVLTKYLSDKLNRKKQYFASIIIAEINNKIKILQGREQTKLVTNRLKIYKQIIKNIKTE